MPSVRPARVFGYQLSGFRYASVRVSDTRFPVSGIQFRVSGANLRVLGPPCKALRVRVSIFWFWESIVFSGFEFHASGFGSNAYGAVEHHPENTQRPPCIRLSGINLRVSGMHPFRSQIQFPRVRASSFGFRVPVFKFRVSGFAASFLDGIGIQGFGLELEISGREVSF